MAAKLRLTPEQRGEALFLLDKGFTVDRASRALQEIHHPEHPVEVVKRAYFPPTGGHFAISSMEGKSSEEIQQKFFRLVKAAKQLREAPLRLKGDKKYLAVQAERTKRLWETPGYRRKTLAALRKGTAEYMAKPGVREALIERSRPQMLGIWKRPGFREKIRAAAAKGIRKYFEDPAARAAAGEKFRRLARDPAFMARHKKRGRETMLRLQRDPDFLAKQQVGLERFRGEIQRLRAGERFAAEKPGGVEQSISVPVHRPQMEETIDLWRGLTSALARLDPLQRFIVAHKFGIDLYHSPVVVREASKLSKFELQSELKAAYEELSKNPKLKKLLGE